MCIQFLMYFLGTIKDANTRNYRDFQDALSPWEMVGQGKDYKPESFKIPAPEPPKKEEPKK